ncbi:MAG TPA: hypothetical protein V6D06_07270 [Trichocoleus sp.]
MKFAARIALGGLNGPTSKPSFGRPAGIRVGPLPILTLSTAVLMGAAAA